MTSQKLWHTKSSRLYESQNYEQRQNSEIKSIVITQNYKILIMSIRTLKTGNRQSVNKNGNYGNSKW